MTDAGAGERVCGVCGRALPASMLRPVAVVSGAVRATLDRDEPEWAHTSWICSDDLRRARQTTIEEMIREDHGELTVLDRAVLKSLAASGTVTVNPEEVYDKRLDFGDRLADRLAGFAGSWTFLLSFAGVLVLWIGVNSFALFSAPFDPYPFILLNLILSCVAAVQAPLIMMSQRRQEEKDRLRSENDYRINLKAEVEIRRLHEKMDHHLLMQWDHLTRLGKAQDEIVRQLRAGSGADRKG
ncbi:DUF1003 domain-containing protein [Consotaella salsifontis]|uniref:Uncharacterized membrane protein n=1 Tax=Consotaella salsifontis TaxID=1365950 RepID=A0A1T4QKJ8_9HYPH|nr:DUF1003 domain-containing protein [Consotaella salsifontis]SKA03778.1 Uncharacterized membrane protein [Consotaella salsifontis]